MSTLSDADALALSYEFENFADTLGAFKKVPGISDADWSQLDEAEGHLRAQASILTTWAVGKTIDDAAASLSAIQAAITKANAVADKIATVAKNIGKVAGVLSMVGSLIALGGAITSGNLPAIASSVANLGTQAAAL